MFKYHACIHLYGTRASYITVMTTSPSYILPRPVSGHHNNNNNRHKHHHHATASCIVIAIINTAVIVIQQCASASTSSTSIINIIWNHGKHQHVRIHATYVGEIIEHRKKLIDTTSQGNQQKPKYNHVNISKT